MKTKVKTIVHDYFKFPLYILLHPFDGYEDFKRYKKAKFSVAIEFIVIFAYYQIFAFRNLGFLINMNNPQNLNSLNLIFSVFLLVFGASQYSVNDNRIPRNISSLTDFMY